MIERKDFKRDIIKKINNMQELGIYIHIPFCIKKCAYCDFLSGPATKDVIQSYIRSLEKEIEANRLIAPDYRIKSIFFGGGTPSILEAEAIEQILYRIRKLFYIEETAEITMECNPGTLTEEKLKRYRKSGINRLSIGLQSIHENELQMLGRIHTFETFLENYKHARNAGFDNINIDLMSGLPDQTPDTWKETLSKIIALQPEHISAYSLIIEEDTEFYERNLSLPEEEIEREIYHITRSFLEQNGYHRYEISNYAKEGYECKHNLNYWRRGNYLGFGTGAASLLKETRFSNTRNRTYYIEHAGELNLIREEVSTLSVTEQMEEFMFLGLRCMSGISVAEFKENFSVSFEEVYGEITEHFVRLGLMNWQNDRVSLTIEGIDVSNSVMTEYLVDKLD